MRKQRPEKIKAKRVSFRNDARVRGAERNSAGLTREALNLEAIFDKPNFEAMNLMEAVVERYNMIKALVQVE